jgi:peptidoglycan/xylan/chitin deacetylase (PgdA/CDA1 family)
MRSLRAAIGVVLSAVLGATASFAAATAAAAPAAAEQCPGNPDALGTSRVLVLEPGKLTRVGVMQYPQSLPLADKEVVLTFDDGPLPRYSNAILDILTAQCVKATYFLVGSMAREFPAVVRRIHEAGHTIGTHTENHPSRMHKLPIEKVRAEIDQGIADVSAALWDAKDLAPFFRIPGLNRSDAIEAELAARSLVVFSSDTLADDWYRRIKPADIVRRAMSRLEARGKGILLLHDIHAVTVAALPDLLKKLKEAGFHVVHVVPGTAEQIEIANVPPHEMTSDPPLKIANDPPREVASEPPHDLASDPPREIASEPPLDRNEPDWPTSVALPTAGAIELPVPDENAFATDYRPWHTVILADGSEAASYLALDAVTQWTDPPATPPTSEEPKLPVPAIPDYFGGGETVTSIAE